jgi:hypothetical protein
MARDLGRADRITGTSTGVTVEKVVTQTQEIPREEGKSRVSPKETPRTEGTNTRQSGSD